MQVLGVSYGARIASHSLSFMELDSRPLFTNLRILGGRASNEEGSGCELGYWDIRPRQRVISSKAVCTGDNNEHVFMFLVTNKRELLVEHILFVPNSF